MRTSSRTTNLGQKTNLGLMMLVLTLVTLVLAETGCSAKKGKPAFTSVPVNGISLTSFQNQADPNWLVNDSGDLLTNAATISLGGYCSQGASSIVITLDGTDVGSNPDCNVTDRYWTYTGPLAGADGSHIIIIYAKSSDGTPLLTGAITKVVEKDTTAPVISGLTFPTVSPYSTSSSSLSVTGTVTGGFWTMTTTDSQGAFTLSNMATSASTTGNFTLATGFFNGVETRTITLVAYDKAGNASAPYSVVVTYSPSGSSGAMTLAGSKEAGIDQATAMTSGSLVLSSTSQTSIGGASVAVSTNAAYTLEADLGSMLVQ